jgi:hypothetical protein
MDQEWEIHHVGRKVVDAPLGMFVIEWTLNHTPESEWIKYLISAPGQKSGSMSFIASAPEVSANRLRITVPEGDLENAVRWVEGSIESANQTFYTYVVSRRQQEDEGRQEEKAARERRIMEARQRLDRMDP